LLSFRIAGERLAHLDDTYMLGGHNDTLTDCQLSEGSEIYWELFNVAPYCAISFPFSRADVVFKDTTQQATFGLIPLQVEKLYQLLRYSARLDWLWARGNSIRDAASATHWLFTITTALPMSNHTVQYLTLQNPNGLVQVLDSSATSPVFLVTRSSLSIVTGPTDSQPRSWRGFDFSAPNVNKVWTEQDLKAGPLEDTYLIYYSGKGRLPVNPPPQNCDWEHSTVSNGTTKIYPVAA
jgi:hypothetical protein